jgi:hypothetical protein
MQIRIRKLAGLLGLIAVSLTLCGCDEDARNFATKTKAILDQRSDQLAKKIAAEKGAYEKEAASANEDHRALVELSLQNERNERTDSLAADYDEGRRSVSQWRKDLSEYAKIDFDTNRKLLTEEMDTKSRYLQNFEDLKIEQDKVDALSKLLAALAKKPTAKEDLAALGSFAEDTKQEFDKKVCTQLNSQKSGTTDAAKAAAKAYDAKKCGDILKAK